MMATILYLLIGILTVAIFVTRTFGEEEEEDDGEPSLLELLREAEEADHGRMDWERILRRLGRHPEEAAAYCHSVDASPLLRCLSCREADIPVAVIKSFLEAHDIAVYHRDPNGLTPLMAAVKRTSVVLTAANDNEEEEVEEAGDQDDSTNAEQAVLTNSRDIIQLLLQANPMAASEMDVSGKLPLHYCRTDLVSAEWILEAFPEAVHTVDKEHGRLPLHYLCCLAPEEPDNQQEDDNAATPPLLQRTLPNPEVAKLLLKPTVSDTVHPVLCEDKKGLRPVDILCAEIQTLLDKKESSSESSMVLDTLWEVLTVLVASAADVTHTLLLVHQLVSLRCPAEIVAESLRRFPQQAVERDSQGRTPLLVAVGMLDYKRTAKDAGMCQIICELIKCNSAAARMTDHEGRLAIDALAEAGVYDEQLFECLVKAEPRAVDTRDLKNKQHPFVTAALAGPDRANVSSVYHLLRAKPHVIQYYCLD